MFMEHTDLGLGIKGMRGASLLLLSVAAVVSDLMDFALMGRYPVG